MAVHGTLPSTRQGQIWMLWAASITPRRAFCLAGGCGAGTVSGTAGAPLKEAAMDIVTIGEVLIDLTPSAPLRWMLPSAPKS